MTMNAGQYAPGTTYYMDVENIFEQYFNGGTETDSKGAISAQIAASDSPSSNSLHTTDSSPPSTTRSAAASPQVSSMPYFDESQMEGLWDHFALEDSGGYRVNTTQGGNMYSAAGGVSVPAIPPLPSATIATMQLNQVTQQPPQFFSPQKYQQLFSKSAINPPLQTLVHGYPSNTQAVHGQVTPVEDNQQTGIPVFPSNVFNNGLFTGRTDSPPQSRTGSISPQKQQSARRPRRNSKATDDPGAKEERRRRFLERNRVAASKCRQKKKEWMQNLEETARAAQNNSKYLHAAVAQLKDELLLLKQELLKHHGCDCTKIRTYLMQEAEKVVVGQQQRSSGVSTPTKPRQPSIEGSVKSEKGEVDVLGEESDVEAMDEAVESKDK